MDWKVVGLEDDIVNKFLHFNSICSLKKGKNMSHLIWLTTGWCIWLERNNILLDKKVTNIQEVILFLVYLLEKL